MKTALCFYGQPRFLEEAYNHTYKDVIAYYNCDVFIHTYWHKDYVGTPYPCRAPDTFSAQDIEVKDGIIDKICDLYNPKNIKVDWYDNLNLKHKNFQYYTQYAVKNIKKDYEKSHNIIYDMVIRTRFDYVLSVKKYDFDMNFLWVPDTCPNPWLYSDNFSVSNSINYDKISDCYVNLDEYSKTGEDAVEYAFYRQVREYDIPIKKFGAQADAIRSNRIVLSI